MKKGGAAGVQGCKGALLRRARVAGAAPSGKKAPSLGEAHSWQGLGRQSRTTARRRPKKVAAGGAGPAARPPDFPPSPEGGEACPLPWWPICLTIRTWDASRCALRRVPGFGAALAGPGPRRSLTQRAPLLPQNVLGLGVVALLIGYHYVTAKPRPSQA